MNYNSNEHYKKTNFSEILQTPQIQENNFISIIKKYEDISKNILSSDKNKIEEKNLPNTELDIHQPNNPKNLENLKDSEDLLNDKSKIVEISENGSIRIKNNIFFQDKNDNVNFKLENNNILNFDDKAENIFLNYNSSNKNKKKENTDFVLEDIPININNDNYENKWKKFFLLYKERYLNLIKKNIFNILDNLINSKINSKIKLPKSHNENINEESNIRNSYNTQSIRDSTDSRVSYENLTNIITTTKINNLGNSSDFKNTINNINININNSQLIMPTITKFNDKSENLSSSIRKNNYKATNISKLFNINNNSILLDYDKFKNMIDFIKYKENIYMNNINDNDSANVRISLDSDNKKKEYNIYTINEEDNESYDSLSLQKSKKNSAKITPIKIESKKSSFKDMEGSNNFNNLNNLSNIFNYNKDNNYKSKIIEKIDIEKNEEEMPKINNNNKEKKIITIDLDLNKNKIKEDNNLNNSNDMEISDNEKVDEKNEVKNYMTPESKEKTIEKLYESTKIEGNKKQELKEFIIDSNKLKFSDFNNIMNDIEENEENKNKTKNEEEFNKGKNQDKDTNKEEIESFKILNISKKNHEEEIPLNPNIQNSLKDSSHIHDSKIFESNLSEHNDINTENKKDIVDSNSNYHFASSIHNINDNTLKEFLRFSVNDINNNKIIFSKDNNAQNSKICTIPLDSYYYILQLCFKKKLLISKKYEKFIKKLMNILEKNESYEIISNEEKNYGVMVDEEIKNFETNLKNLKNSYIDLIIKKKKKLEKEKLEIDNIVEQENNIRKIFNNLIALGQNNGNKKKIFLKKIKDVLKKYNKIKKEEINEAKNKECKIQNKLKLTNDNDLLSNIRRRKIFTFVSVLVPLLFIFKYFVRYSK